MIAARQIAFGDGGKRKPYDAEVEYLESTGTQYIDTGVIAQANDSYVLDLWYSRSGGFDTIFGAANDSGSNKLATVWITNGGAIRYGGNMGVGFSAGTWRLQDWNTIESSHSRNLINGVKALDNITTAFDNSLSTKSIYLFQCNGRVFAKGITVRIRKHKWYRDGVLVLDLIPVRVGNVGYMYDRVSGQLFGNQGTGAFIIGDDV
jgi:hypothetical protein